MYIRCLICVALVSLATVGLSAHDFWLAAANWTPAAGAPVTIAAGIGERFPILTGFKPRPGWFDQWRVIGAAGDIPVTTAFQGSELMMTTEVTLPSPGAYLGVMRVTPRIEDMKGPEFTDYLKEEGLERIIAARQAAGEADRPARELYARYAKIALRNGDGSGAHLTRPIGLKAEFVPTTDPTSVPPGGSLTVQLLTDGQPVGDAAVSCRVGRRLRDGPDRRRGPRDVEDRSRRCMAHQNGPHGAPDRLARSGVGELLGHALVPHRAALNPES